MSQRVWTVAITGASGVCYGISLLNALARNDAVSRVHVIISEAGFRVLHEEEGRSLSPSTIKSSDLIQEASDKFVFHHYRDIGAAVASGSYLVDGMVIVPCSMSTLGALAHGVQQNLIHRAADVIMKERRKLILVPRETPLSAIHLQNMATLATLGTTILPAMPGFYHQPKTIDDLVNMQVMKILDSMGIANSESKRWRSDEDKQ